MFKNLQQLRATKSIRTKLLWTLGCLALYRLLVFIPVPFADVAAIQGATAQSGGGLEYFAILLGGTLENFSLIAVGLIPYINASIIMQLLTAVVPALEELQEQGEQGTQKIQQFTRRLTVPLAFAQSIGMVYFMNYLLGGNIIPTDFSTLMITAFALTVGSVLVLWIGELITEKGLTNGISLIIFASIVSGISSQIFTFTGAAGGQLLSVVLFMLVIVLGLVLLCVLLVKTRKDIPVVYARQGAVQETASLPIPLNPVGMIPIIFAVAFATFPYLLSQIVINMGSQNATMQTAARWIEANFNIYTQQPTLLVIGVYFLLIILFTFFYAVITFNPDKMADNIQKRGGFIPGIRPGEETAKYLNGILMHLCLWGGIGLWLVGIYTYILSYIPLIQTAIQTIGQIPVIVQGSGVVIIVGVVQELMTKVSSEALMEKYDRI
jgi:preprotein translocase subunit SecY